MDVQDHGFWSADRSPALLGEQRPLLVWSLSEEASRRAGNFTGTLPAVETLDRRLGSAIVDYLSELPYVFGPDSLQTLLDYALESGVEDVRYHSARLIGRQLFQAPVTAETRESLLARSMVAMEDPSRRRYAAIILGEASSGNTVARLQGRIKEWPLAWQHLVSLERRPDSDGVPQEIVSWIIDASPHTEFLAEILERASRRSGRRVFGHPGVSRALRLMLDWHPSPWRGDWQVRALAADRAVLDNRIEDLEPLRAGMQESDGEAEAKTRMRKAYGLLARGLERGDLEGIIEEQLRDLETSPEDELRYSSGAVADILETIEPPAPGLLRRWLVDIIRIARTNNKEYTRKTAVKLMAKLSVREDLEQRRSLIIHTLLEALNDPAPLVREEAVLSLVKRVPRSILRDTHLRRMARSPGLQNADEPLTLTLAWSLSRLAAFPRLVEYPVGLWAARAAVERSSARSDST